MRTIIDQSNVIHTQELNNYITSSLKWLKGYDRRDQFPMVKIWLSKNTGFFNRGTPEFVTKVLVRARGREIFAKSKASKLTDSIDDSMRKIKKMVFNSNKGEIRERTHS